ncbi:hypothetical protein JTB14_022044 [Gonioctena quinquepunctata]|nr:hypothetical protein JTB14_022044 [Gonioctena quinquepunctata]
MYYPLPVWRFSIAMVIFHAFRSLLDGGSMTPFISQKAVTKLGLSKKKCSVEVKGLGSMQSHVMSNTICDYLPATTMPYESWSHIVNLRLADPNFSYPGEIDLLLEADIFSKIILNDRISGNMNERDAMNTVFGYIIMATVGSPPTAPISFFFCQFNGGYSEKILGIGKCPYGSVYMSGRSIM